MIRTKFIFLLTILSITSLFSSHAQNNFVHTVEKGQGLYSISRMYGVSEEDIIRLNPGSDKVIYAGQTLIIPKNVTSDSNSYHTVASGETLYSLSKSNNVSIKEICDANPGLTVETLKAGMIIVIPKSAYDDSQAETIPDIAGQEVSEMKTLDGRESANNEKKTKARIRIERRTTIYRICKDFGMTEDEFLTANPQYRTRVLRQGDIVVIPRSDQELAEMEENELKYAQFELEQILEGQTSSESSAWTPRHVAATMLLPFGLDESSAPEKSKMLEFTRGVLLAVKKLKAEGISVDLKILDTGDEGTSIDKLIESPSFEETDIIFGPKWTGHISDIAAWSSSKSIPVVLPFNSNADEVFTNPHIFQLITPQSYFTQDILDHFEKQFKRPNIIILESGEMAENHFLENLELLASDKHYSIHKVPVDTTAQPIIDCIDSLKQNIFILDSPESGPLQTMLPILQLINRTKSENVHCCLFGYPEYQIYASNLLEQFCECDTWFYSWFYTNNLLQESVDFGNDFIRSFGRQMMVSFPNYASYGYDAGYYFLKGIALFGPNFEKNLDNIQTKPVQMGFKFDRVSNWGGFINRKVFFVHFSNEYKVEKIDFDR